MRAIFLSDAHLRRETAENYRFLLQFFDELKKGIGNRVKGKGPCSASPPVRETKPIDALYLMGDFFDFWFAKGDRYYPGFDSVIRSIREMKELGVEIHIFEGNHDFFLGDFFSGHLGIKVYRDDASIDLDGHRIYVAHGDLVDRSNRGYLLLRKFLRSRLVYALQGILPSALLWRISLVSSDASKAMWAESGKNLTDKMCRFALDAGAQGYDGVILGHSHQPLLWEFSISGERKALVTLGDWLSHRSYLDYTDGRFSLKYYKNNMLRDETENCDFSFECAKES
ncbi:MAG TPA: UDP-2,3-diacylglucosamine diphosphatase [Syntrophales bacterium]|jgi:UDP-2,3-diacylglucosamine hydrolase|nr:UDP-2,3-diacylglucosamine diphosphatase [Syntrophales bacterium]HPX56926.1 UDP-2,3-diacylglucosamine diphosphatase [Syntrophales bacterium]HQA82976.1 UDP-2,3-diacylglucosamine diphosphatase [Syntrophales bacterium]